MQLSRRLVDFNKQIFFGEIGAVVGTPLAPWCAAHFTRDPTSLSLAAVVGGLVTGSLFWLAMKVRDEHRSPEGVPGDLVGQIALYTPAAFVAGLIVYQPTLFFLTRSLIISGRREALAAVLGQAAAFGLFLIAINLYRILIRRVFGRQL